MCLLRRSVFYIYIYTCVTGYNTRGIPIIIYNNVYAYNVYYMYTYKRVWSTKITYGPLMYSIFIHLLRFVAAHARLLKLTFINNTHVYDIYIYYYLHISISMIGISPT